MRRRCSLFLGLAAVLAGAVAAAAGCTNEPLPDRPALTGSIAPAPTIAPLPTLPPDTIPTTVPAKGTTPGTTPGTTR